MNSLLLATYLFFCSNLNSIITSAFYLNYPTPPPFASTTPMTPPIPPTYTINPPTPPVEKSHSSNNIYIIGGSVIGGFIFFGILFSSQFCFKALKEYYKKDKN